MSVADLPHVNAAINTCVAVLLIVGLVLIKRGRRDAHRNVMVAALALSALFLASYVTYHYLHGSTKFQGQGMIRPVYFTILLTHTVLAVVNLPLVVVTVARAWRGEFDKHRRIAKWTWFIWLYVATTGPIVYLMLYQLYPSDGGVAAFEEAQSYHQRDGRAAAIPVYLEALSQGHVGAGCYVAVIEQTETSSAAVLSTLRAHPEDVHCVTLLGREYVYRNDLPAAKLMLEKAVKLAPNDAFTHASLGFLQFREYSYADAAASFTRATEIDGSVAMYVYNAGYAYFLRGDYKEAAPLFERALKMGLAEDVAARAQEDLDVINGAIWVCPMHNHERGKKGDRCSECKMLLEPVSRGVSEQDQEEE